MSKIRRDKYRNSSHPNSPGHATCLLAGTAVYCLFFSDFSPHNFKTAGPRCYSPNREYFTIRLVTPWRSIWRDYLDGRGTGELYTKHGVRLHSEKAIVADDEMMATDWQDTPPSVSMWGVDQEI